MPAQSAQFRQQLGVKIRALRIGKGWSQEQLAERAGISYKFLGEMERGAANPSIDTLFEVARALGMDAGELFAVATPVQFSRLDRERLFSAREALESLDDLLKDLADPPKRVAARRRTRKRKTG